MKPGAWTEAHRCEALARFHELFARFAREGRGDYTTGGSGWADDEKRFRQRLSMLECLSDAEIDREVRRMRALAEGRLVRETEERYAVRRDDGETPGVFMAMVGANEYARSPERPKNRAYRVVPVRVTRIRRPR